MQRTDRVADDYDIEIAEWEAIRRRDDKAFARWFARCEIRLRQSLRRFNDIVDAEAVVQETVIQIWEHDASRIAPDGRPEFLLRWACVVARNKAINIAKRTGRRLDQLETHSKLPPPAQKAAGDPLLKARIGRCLQELPSTLLRVLRARLRDDGQHSDRELAGPLEISFAAFRQNLARGRRGLKDCLKKHGIEIREYIQ